MEPVRTAPWIGDPPVTCDVCKEPLETEFVDGAIWSGVRGSVWAIVCPKCHFKHGFGLGIGRGQCYRRQADGTWVRRLRDKSAQEE